ncbi:unnamed protein product [Moneuplotes crassus]|uniref:Uncharacterized protein n=1 Tax=Euplotes crassus TaxID=5936 RepID=A0AAD1U491_EUPCR|nr:unnamed protein product [Moneuplotes crassus]
METSKQLCRTSSCGNFRGYYCKDHKETLCHSCHDAFHFQCDYMILPKPDEIVEATVLLQSFVHSLYQDASDSKLMDKIKGLQESLDNFNNVVKKYKEKAFYAVKKDEFLTFNDLKLEARSIKSDAFKGKYGISKAGDNHIFELLFHLQLIKCMNKKMKSHKDMKIENTQIESVKPVDIGIDTDRPTCDPIGEKEKLDMENTDSESNHHKEEVELDTGIEKDNTNTENSIVINNQISKSRILENEISKYQAKEETQSQYIEEMKEEINDLVKENTYLKENMKTNKNIKSESETIDDYYQAKCRALYKNYFKIGHQFDQDSICCLDLNSTIDINFMNALLRHRVKLPRIQELSFESQYCKDLNYLNRFISQAISGDLKLFNIVCSSWIIEGAKIISGLSNTLSKVIKEADLGGLILSSQQFCDIIGYSTQMERLVFRSCQINIGKDIIEIKMINTRMHYLGFPSTQIKDPCWPTSLSVEDMFGKIIKAVSGSSIKNTLEILDISDCCVKKQEIIKKLKKNGLENVLVQKNDKTQ